ncbi:hypothetical protein [Polaromonas sp. JS666]|uniref:hypothetical protein n=1 Tax=Polaromonas sp. (strain JS666 / ATCC BAA-500) TaxID=296591 RepID=UPI000888FA71|nr:hypothetical protein [Polaromonas sp. JS666]SDM33750.1 hypothetical protein SAMN05720382_1016 [Polaromonas sp. JS666]
MRLRIFSTLLLCFALGACASKHLKPDGVSASSLTSTNGILVGSFARSPDGPVYYSQTFYFKNVKTGEVHQIKAQPTFNLYTGKTPDDFSTESSAGAVFVFSLPAGPYTFHNFRLYQANGAFQQNWSSKNDYSIPFEVQPDTVNYVGEIKLDALKGRNFFGMTVPAGGVWLVSDQLGRDLEILQRTRTDIPVSNMVSVIPTRKDVFTPLVVLPSEMNEYLSRTKGPKP